MTNKNTPLSEKLKKRVKNWADTYNHTNSYILGKKVGAMHAVHILKQIEKQE